MACPFLIGEVDLRLLVGSAYLDDGLLTSGGLNGIMRPLDVGFLPLILGREPDWLPDFSK